MFYERVSADSEEIHRHYKAPTFSILVQYLFAAQLDIVLHAV